MMILIIGRPDSGKSAFAEAQAMDLARAGRKIYIATMIPFGEEGRLRVKKHRCMREGKGFETIECPEDLTTLTGLSEAVCLLECVSNLVGNEMHAEANRGKAEDELCRVICDEVAYLKDNAGNLVVVSNEFEPEAYDGGDPYDGETRSYISLQHQVNLRLKDLADRVYIKGQDGWTDEKVM